MAKASTIKLNNGKEIPVIGLGTYARGGSQNKECQLAVEAAIKCGYRHIDTAAFYDNEEEVGFGIQNGLSTGVASREDIFVTTKIWNNCHEESQVIPTLKKSLAKLGLTYIDLYLVHWPIGVKEDGTYSDVDYLDTWKGMEKCVELGLAKSIGVSNFSIEQLKRVLDNCKIKPVTNQFEVNPNLTQKELITFCKANDVAVTAYCPLGSMPEAKTSESAPAPRLDDPLLKSIGEKYGNKTTTQVVLRYLIDCGCIVIPKSVTPSRIAQNIDIFDLKLTKEEIAKIDAFNVNKRMVAVSFWKDHKYFPF